MRDGRDGRDGVARDGVARARGTLRRGRCFANDVAVCVTRDACGVTDCEVSCAM